MPPLKVHTDKHPLPKFSSQIKTVLSPFSSSHSVKGRSCCVPQVPAARTPNKERARG